MGVNEGFDACEAEAGAVGIGTGCEEGFEEVSAGGIVKAVAVIVERECDAGRMGGRDEANTARITEGGAGVEGEIDEGVAELGEVDGDGEGGGGVVGIEAMASTEELAEGGFDGG